MGLHNQSILCNITASDAPVSSKQGTLSRHFDCVLFKAYRKTLTIYHNTENIYIENAQFKNIHKKQNVIQNPWYLGLEIKLFCYNRV